MGMGKSSSEHVVGSLGETEGELLGHVMRVHLTF